MEGGTTFHFVTDGIEAALEQAREAAGGKDVMLWGGGNIAGQYLAAGLLDEFECLLTRLRGETNRGGASPWLTGTRHPRGSRTRNEPR